MSIVKQSKTENGSSAVTKLDPKNNNLDVNQLTGHGDQVLAVQFDYQGQLLASGSRDRTILLWNNSEQNKTDYTNFALLRHKGAVLDLKWSRDSRCLYSCSSDLTIGIWDVETSQRLVKQAGHKDIINSITTPTRGSEQIISGSDDGSVCVWDPDSKNCELSWSTGFPILAVACNPVGDVVYSTGIESCISAWDIRKPSEPLYTLPGHNQETITALSVDPSGEYLASNGQDNAVRTWDIKPFVSKDQARSLKVYDGAAHDMAQNLHRVEWTRDGSKLGAACSDGTVVIWDAHTRRIHAKLAGHKGSVNDLSFSDTQVATASSDRSVIVGPLN